MIRKLQRGIRMAEHMRSHFECLGWFLEKMRGYQKGGKK